MVRGGMRTRALLPLISPLVALACVSPANTDVGSEGTATEATAGTGESGDGDVCLEAQDGVARTYDVELIGFAEVGPDGLFTAAGPLDYTGSCTLETMSFAGAELSLELACEHAMPTDPSGARVVVTTAASGLPAGLEEGASLSLEAVAYESEGGDTLPPDVAALVSDVTNVQYYRLSDDDGPVFLANVHGPTISTGEVEMSLEHCEAWTGCSDAGTIAGYVTASAGQTSIDVQIGEVGVLMGASMSYDVSLFQARLDSSDCHFGSTGGVSVVRRPA